VRQCPNNLYLSTDSLFVIGIHLGWSVRLTFPPWINADSLTLHHSFHLPYGTFLVEAGYDIFSTPNLKRYDSSESRDFINW
jgi:hypothetical protein